NGISALASSGLLPCPVCVQSPRGACLAQMLPPPCAQTCPGLPDYPGGRNNAPAAFVWAPVDSRITEIRSCGHLQAVRFLAKVWLRGKTRWQTPQANEGLGEAMLTGGSRRGVLAHGRVVSCRPPVHHRRPLHAPATPPSPRLTSDRPRALELLAASRDGCTEA